MSHDAAGDNTPDRSATLHTLRASAPSAGDTPGSVANDLARFNASLELFCRKLGRVLPDISREINNTYHKASLTMDSLISEDPVGLIEITVSALDVSLARIDKHLRDQKAGDALISKDLEAFRTGLPAAGGQMEEFSRHLDELAALYPPMEGAANAPLTVRRMQALNAQACAMIGIIRELADHQSRLSENMETAAVLHSGIIRTVEMHTALGVKSLKDTLGSIIVILKDLISRSTATKVPILAIMTALQIHDIVRQDIENILKVFERLRALSKDADHPDRSAFMHEACTVSGGLLFDISLIVHDHVQTIARHIQGIHEIIAGVKADKIHLAELLLINTQGGSTLDRAMAEIAAMFQDLSERLKSLAALGKRRSETLQALRALIDELNQSSLACLQEAQALDKAYETPGRDRMPLLLAAGQNMRSAITALTVSPVRPGAVADAQARDATEECITLIQEDTEALRGSLLTIKGLLVDSIDGINDYADRCMLAVLRFKRRMQRLNLFLVRLPDIAETLKTSAGSPVEAPQAADIPDAELKALLMPLYHPHIKTLNRTEAHHEDAPPDNGDLTLF